MKSLSFAVFLEFTIALSVLQDGVAAQEEYQEVDRSELNLDFEASFQGASCCTDDGKMVIKGGKVNKLTLDGKEIRLSTKKISEDGFVDTTDFGKIKVTFNSRLLATIWLTPSQKQAMKALSGR